LRHFFAINHAAFKQHGDFARVDLVVFILATMDSSHVECMTKDKGDVVL